MRRQDEKVFDMDDKGGGRMNNANFLHGKEIVL